MSAPLQDQVCFTGTVRQVVDRQWVDVPVELTVRCRQLVRELGLKALSNKSGKATASRGAIVVRRIG
ncbi:MAG: hypothetical protein WC107_06180 [Patescibacteria group bacterium]